MWGRDTVETEEKIRGELGDRVKRGLSVLVRRAIGRARQMLGGKETGFHLSFREAARILNVRLEYAGIQCPEDKPYIESFFGSYKTEELYRNEYSSLAEARTGWESYRAWDRYDRLHQRLRYRARRNML